MTYQNIPDELKKLKQWCVCSASDKIPLNPSTLNNAITTNANTWGTFEQATSAVADGYADNIGFVVAQTDPYTFVDFDNKADDPVPLTDWELQLGWLRMCPGAYVEPSISGRGIHIFVRGKIPYAAKTRYTEVYDWGRFAIFSGAGEPVEFIPDGQDMLDDMLGVLTKNESFKAESPIDLSENEEKSDEEIFRSIANSENAEKFTAIAQGHLEPYFSPEQTSEADASFFAMLSVHTRNREQMKRIFKAVPLSQREWVHGNTTKRYKHQKSEYSMTRAINYALQVYRQEHPQVNYDDLKQQIAQISLKEAKKHGPKKNRHIPWPPGVAGHIAQDIYASSKVPNVEYSVTATLGLLAGIAAREYSISDLGLNLYVVTLGETSTGKEGITSGFNRWMAAIAEQAPTILGIRGPDYFGSGQALRKIFDGENLCKISVVSEFGYFIQALTSDKANDAARQLKRNLLAMFSKSGMNATLESMVYSDKEKNVEAVAGATFSMIGEGVPSSFFTHLGGQDIASGMLSRLLMLRNEDPTAYEAREERFPAPNPNLVMHLVGLFNTAMHLRVQKKACEVLRTPEGAEMLSTMKTQIVSHMNAVGPSDERDLMGRSHLKALKLAALLAVADNAVTPTITAEHAQWAITVVANDFRIASEAIKSGEMGGDTVDAQQKALVAEVRKVLAKTPEQRLKGFSKMTKEMVDAGLIPQSELTPRLSRRAGMVRTQDIQMCLKQAVDAGVLIALQKGVVKERFQKEMLCYSVGDAFPA